MTENSREVLEEALGFREADRIPMVVRFFVLTEEARELIPEFIPGSAKYVDIDGRIGVRLPVRDGVFIDAPAYIGDYIIEGVDGQYYNITNAQFNSSYTIKEETKDS